MLFHDFVGSSFGRFLALGDLYLGGSHFNFGVDLGKDLLEVYLEMDMYNGESSRARLEEIDMPTLCMQDKVEGIKNKVDLVNLRMEELARFAEENRRTLEDT